MSTPEPATALLAEWAAAQTWDLLPSDVIDTAKRSVRDIIGVALFASRLEWSELVAGMAGATAAPGRSTVWGTPARLSAPYAALTNGTAAHGIEMDDRCATLDIHNGAPTVSAAVAVAEEYGRSGRDVILGVVCGYEVAFRLARATARRVWPRFHIDGLWTVFGAAAAAGKVLGLDARGLVNAMGLAGGMASGLMEFSNDSRGTMVKRLQGGGWPAYCGVTSALLAAEGMDAPPSSLEGPMGICRSFSGALVPDLPALTAGLGTGYEIRLWETKAYGARGSYSSGVDAVGEIMREHALPVSAIARIELGCSTRIYTKAIGPQPESIMAAQYHLGFVVAVSLHHDLRDPSVWETAILRDPAVLDTFRRVEIREDEEANDLHARTGRASAMRARVVTRDGRSFEAFVLGGKGTPENPMTHDDVVGKFELLAGRALGRARTRELGARIDDLDGGGPLVLRDLFEGAEQ
ncbi:MmgE/PrpD family protein [Acrocarpospora catenulata]|uniref:MmgE/PrpD family protein n=1 Tax=Acrocarpospora catenulata TaxID=2836182 RepID=UPI001BD98CB9|nr:MmgE/PrpD family protein [Acrocarpospora catenulata]